MVSKDEILKLMDESEAVFLATVDGTSPRIRALVNLRRSDLYPNASAFCRSQGTTLYFSTSGASAKVREIRKNPAASVYYCDPGKTRGITLSGEMEILTDPELKRALWSDDWRIYWSGSQDPDYVVLRMKPSFIAGWWGSEPAQVEANLL